MERLWLVLVLVPFVYLVLAARRQPGLARQHHITTSGTPERLTERIEAAGGVRNVRSGLLLDHVFVLFFATTATLGLWRAGGVWWLPLVAAAVDTAENLLLGALLRREPSPAATRVLALVAVAKLLAYGAVLVAALWAALSP